MNLSQPLGGARFPALPVRRGNAAAWTHLLWFTVAASTLTLTAVLIVVGAWQLHPGLDYGIYMDRARDWLAGDGFYLPRQLAGTYAIENGDSLYPPITLLLFAPFTFLPAVLWWGIPIGITAAVVWYWRPSLQAVAVIGILMTIEHEFPSIVIKGNPMMWVAAFAALATVRPAFGPLALLRPTAFPFALIGIRERSWWLTAALCAVACLAFLPMWPDWLASVRDGQGEGLFVHHLLAWPTVLIPVVARWGSTQRSRPMISDCA